MRSRFIQSIEAPAERVFTCIEDPDLRRQWQTGLEETRYTEVPPGDDPVGTRFVARVREGGRIVEYDGELIAHDRPHFLKVRARSAALEVCTAYRIERGSGTAAPSIVHVTVEIAARGMLSRLLLSLGRVLLARIVRGQLRALKAVAEAGA